MDAELRSKLLAILRLSESSGEVQKRALDQLEAIARSRLALAIPEMLSTDQLITGEKLRDDGKSESEIVAWVKAQLPAKYSAMMEALLLDIAENIDRMSSRQK